MLEFDTGGNVRFEEGRPGDVWFSSCADLVKSRVITAAGQGSASGVKVSRVIRIHNRFLKNRFERCVREAKAPASSTTPSAAENSAGTTPMTAIPPSVLIDKSLSPSQHEGGSSSSGCPPSPPQTSAVEHASTGGLSSGGRQQQLAGSEVSTGDGAREDGEECRRGAGLSTQGKAWRSPLLSVPQELKKRGSGSDSKSSPPCRPCESPSRAAETAATAVDASFVGAPDSGRSSSTASGDLLTSSIPGGGSLSRAAAEGGGKKSDKRSSSSSPSSSPRSLEYLFFTEGRGRTARSREPSSGGDWSNGGGGGGGGAFDAGVGGGSAHDSWQPDLLKLAEDGFRLTDWSEADTNTAGNTATTEEPSAPGVRGGVTQLASQPGTVGRHPAASAGEVSHICRREEEHAPCRAQSVVLSTHLCEADIPGSKAATPAGAAAAANRTSSDSVVFAPPASVGLGNEAFVPPVYRVLVVKVFTGRTRRLPPGSSAGCGEGGGGCSSATRRPPRPGVLREAWATGYKSVCVSGEDGVSAGGGGGGGGHANGEGGVSSKSAPSRYQEWHVLDGALALPEYIIEFDFSPEMGKDGQAIKDGVRQRVNKWRHELAPSYRSSSLASSPSSSSSCPPASTSSKSSTAKATGSGGGGGGGGGSSSGRASGGADVLPFLIPLARLARQLEIDAASYATRYEAGISKALRMQPSAPALGIPPGSNNGKGCGVGSGGCGGSGVSAAPGDRLEHLSACAVAARPGHMLTRLSLHGQGVRTIEGLEACRNLKVLILSFNEISCLHGLAGLTHLRHLDLGYNIIEGVQHYSGATATKATDADENGDAVVAPDDYAGGSGATIVPNIVARGSTEHERSRTSEETPRKAAVFKEAVASAAAARGDAGGGRGKDEGETGCASLATADISLPSLTRLDLNNNILHNLDDLKALWNIAPNLAVLDMRGNPLRAARTYRGAAVRGIPSLEVLDGKSVTHREVSLHNACRTLTLDMLRRNGRRRAPRSTPHRASQAVNARTRRSGPYLADASSREDEGYQGPQMTRGRDSSSSSISSGSDHSQKVAAEVEDRPPGRGAGGRRRRSRSEASAAIENKDEEGWEQRLSASAKEEEEEDEEEEEGGEEEEEEGEDAEDEEEEGEDGWDAEACIRYRRSSGPLTPSTVLKTASRDKSASSIVAADPDSPSNSGSDRDSGTGRPRSTPAAGSVGELLSSNTFVARGGVTNDGETARGDDKYAAVTDQSCPSHPSTGLLLEDIELVNLHNLSLHKLEGMERLVFVRVVDLSGNELHDTAPLRSCACLEELNLEGNELTTAGLRGLVGLRRLMKLDLGYNQISDLHPLCGLTGLSQLSLESNLLHNLRGLTKLVNLMELYCGNNDITSAPEMDRLRSLPRLIILDTSGNPVCSSPHFRLQVLFKIPTLKVLDGVGVGGTEKNEAKLKFIGKLTEEVIFGMYNREKVETIKYLNLSKSKWRSVEVLPTLPFRSLQELNLDNNSLVSFAALGALRSLGVLRLSYNRIDSIGQVESENSAGAAVEEPMFARLEVLYLGFNRITDISALGLECMHHLLAVDLQGNNIGSLGGLNRCRTLVEVNLDGNKIRQLGPPSVLNGLGNLRKLRLEDNGLRVLSPGLGASTPALLSLSLAQNRLSDPAELDRLGALPNLMELSVCGNPMARRPYSRLALLSLFPSLAAVDSADITVEEKRLSEAMAGGSTGVGIITAPSSATSSGMWGLAAPGIGSGGVCGNGVHVGTKGGGGVGGTAGGGGGGAGGGGGTASMAGINRREYVTVGHVGGITRKSTVATQGGGMAGYPTGSIAHSFSPFRPHDGLPPPNAVSGSSRSGVFCGDRGGKIPGADECLVQALTLKLKAGPASPGSLAEGAGGVAVGGQHRGGGGQPHHGSVKWAPLSTARRIGSGGGPKRPLKLTSMNFSASSMSEDERGGTASRGGSRIVSSLGDGVAGNISRTSIVGGDKPGAVSLATLDVGARVSPALPYGKVVSLPSGGSGIGLIRGR
ncbi:unnamed protein product [Ectocarpus sp. 6 AP-2014]